MKPTPGPAEFAVEGFLQSLAPVAATVGVSVGVVEPAAVASEFVANAGLDVPALLAGAGDYAPAMRAHLERARSQFGAAAQSAAAVADVVLGCLSADPLPLRTQTSDAARRFAATSLADLDAPAVAGLTGAWLTS